jgi:hypothetical protein
MGRGRSTIPVWTCLSFSRLISLMAQKLLASLVDAPNAYCKPPLCLGEYHGISKYVLAVSAVRTV